MFRYRIATRLGKSTFESFKKKQVARQFSTHILKERLREIIPKKQSLLASIRKQYGELVIEDVKVNQVIGGMRGMTALIYETSKLDPWTGISYRGHPISEVLKKAPKAKNGDAPLPEGVLWLLLTGEYPNQNLQIRNCVRRFSRERGKHKTGGM